MKNRHLKQLKKDMFKNKKEIIDILCKYLWGIGDHASMINELYEYDCGIYLLKDFGSLGIEIRSFKN